MDKKSNGSEAERDESGKIVHFPTLAARDKARRERESVEKREKTYRARAHIVSGAQPRMFNFSKIPIFTKIIIALLVMIHAGLTLIDEPARYQIFYIFGFVPAYFSGAAAMPTPFFYISPLSYTLIHAGWMHLAFNVIMALTFGILFERSYGARRTAFLWIACGLAGAGLFFLLNPDVATPMVGASGSISGLFAAGILLQHDERQRLGIRAANKGPWLLLLFWLGLMMLTGMVGGDNTAWQAHAGGFLCGAGLYVWFQRARVTRR